MKNAAGRHFICVLLASYLISGLAEARPYVAFGELRGHIAPCGCDPATDLGGVRRIGAVIGDYQARASELLILSLGNNLPEKEDRVKHAAMMMFEKELGSHAILFNTLDERFYLQTTKIAKASSSGSLPYVLSQKDRPKGVFFAIENKGHKIFGYRSREDKAPPLASWGEAIGKSRGKSFLLFSGSIKDLKAIKKARLFNTILLANSTPLGTEANHLEKNEPGRLLKEGVYMVPAFGTGVVRSVSLKRKKLPLFGEKQKAGLSFEKALPLVFLDRQYERGEKVKKTLSFYKKGAIALFEQKAQRRKKDLPKSPFAGAAACKGCHPSSYQIWMKTSHASAYGTLEKNKVDKDPECVSCHVLGYDKKGGFADKESSPQFAGVQCENCHGAAASHVKNPGVKPKKKAESSCILCHKMPHSSAFDYDKYWPKIEHGARKGI